MKHGRFSTIKESKEGLNPSSAKHSYGSTYETGADMVEKLKAPDMDKGRKAASRFDSAAKQVMKAKIAGMMKMKGKKNA